MDTAGIAAATGVLWADEFRVGLRGQVRRVWAPRGVKVRQAVQLVYQWAYLLIGVNGMAGDLRWQWLPNMRKETLAAAVARWRDDGVQGLVWDGAGSHRARVVREVGLPLVQLPPYAPELNPAERVGEEVRKDTEGRVYPALADKQAAGEAPLRALAADSARLARLTAWDWIRAAGASSP